VVRRRLLEHGTPEADVDAAAERARAAVAAAVHAAQSAPPADPAEAFTDVWADGGATWRT
jgi:pyruvate dehydrogenase E1 component alpha subunit